MNAEVALQTAGEEQVYTFLTFYLNDEKLAMDIVNVKEVLEYTNITRVPKVPGALIGVINVRGSVVPVINLKREFDLPDSEVTDETCIVIVEIETEKSYVELGFLVDRVDEVLELTDRVLQSPPSVGNAIEPKFIQHLVNTGDEIFIVLRLKEVVDLNNIYGLNENLEPLAANANKEQNNLADKVEEMEEAENTVQVEPECEDERQS